MQSNIKSIIYALAAALFYAINMPFSKMLLKNVSPTFMAGFLYLGAGIGVAVMYMFHFKSESASERLTRKDIPYTVGMVLLDIIAPIFLMIGINIGTSANASLLGNFEIVATTIIAFVIFKEKVSLRLWIAIALIVVSSVILSFESNSLNFSLGSVFVLLAASCWGLENNCTRNISDKCTYQIVTIKGLLSGGGSVITALLLREKIPNLKNIAIIMVLGFIAYGLSIFTYIRAQQTLGAAKTSAYYATAPFISVLLSFILLKEVITVNFVIALVIMIIGTSVIVYDTLIHQHEHSHKHLLTHTHNGVTHTHIIIHTHEHNHFFKDDNHKHKHSDEELEKCLVGHN